LEDGEGEGGTMLDLGSEISDLGFQVLELGVEIEAGGAEGVEVVCGRAGVVGE